MGLFDIFLDKEGKIEKLENETSRLLESLKNRDQIWMKDWYLRLREKFKHNQNQLLNNAIDWKDYVYSEWQMNHVAMAMGGGDEDGYLGESLREDSIKQFEIENRFAGLLEEDDKLWLKKHRIPPEIDLTN